MLDIFQIIQQWVKGSNLTEKPFDRAEEIWLALGYTREFPDTEAPSQPNFKKSDTEIEEPVSLECSRPTTTANPD